MGGLSGSPVEIFIYDSTPLIRRGEEVAKLAGRDLANARLARALLRVLVLQRPAELDRSLFREADASPPSPNAVDKAIRDLRQRLGTEALVVARSLGTIALQGNVATDHDAVVNALDAGERRTVLELTRGGPCTLDVEDRLARLPSKTSTTRSLSDEVASSEQRIRSAVAACLRDVRLAVDRGDLARAEELLSLIRGHPYANPTHVLAALDRVEAAGGHVRARPATLFPSRLKSPDELHSEAFAGPGSRLLWDTVATLDPIEFGVTPVDPAFGFKDRWGPKIRRAIDEEVRTALSEGLERGRPTFIALVGPSGAGKSRAMRDALLAVCSQAEAVMPDDAAALGRLLDRGLLIAGFPTCGRVLVLDDLELFASAEGITARRLLSLKRHEVPLLIIATAGGKGPSLLAASEREIRAGHLAGVRTHIDAWVEVDGRLSDAELDQAPLRPDLKNRLATDGLIWLTGAQRLREKLVTGQHDLATDAMPTGQLLAGIVLEWHSYGLATGIPEPALRMLARERDPSLSQLDIDAALRWALKPVADDIAILRRSHDGRQRVYEADDALRGDELWFHEEDFALERWREVTDFATPQQRLELLDRQRPSADPTAAGVDAIRDELAAEGAPAEVLAHVEAVRAGMLDNLLTVAWEMAPDWNEDDAERELKRIEDWSICFKEATLAAAAGDDPEGLHHMAEHFVPSRSRGQEHYWRCAFDRAAGGKLWPSIPESHLSVIEPLVDIARAQYMRGEFDALQETCAAAETALGLAAAERIVATCRVLARYAAVHADPALAEEPLTVPAEPDHVVLATHCLEIGNASSALEWAKRSNDVGCLHVHAGSLVQLGRGEEAIDLLRNPRSRSQEPLYDDFEIDVLLADALGLEHRFEEQIQVLDETYEREGAIRRRRSAERRHYELKRREVDAALLSEHLRGVGAAEDFLRARSPYNSLLIPFLADLLLRTGREDEGARVLADRRCGTPSLWGRIFALGRTRLDGPFAPAPWDPDFRRVEAPGYAAATRRIARAGAEAEKPLAMSMLACDSCLHGDYERAAQLIERAALPPIATDNPTEQHVLGTSFDERTDFLWRAGHMLAASGHTRAAESAWRHCASDGLSDALVELGRMAELCDPEAAIQHFDAAAALFHPGATQRAQDLRGLS